MARNRYRRGSEDAVPRIIAAVAVALVCSVLTASALTSCAGRDKPSIIVPREQLFSLGYGPAEDQIDLFQMDSERAALKTRLAMREGLFYIANGAGAKVVRYSSFGDPLSMIYNADTNPEPITLKVVPSDPEAGTASAPDASGLGRKAVSYPFRSVGEISVDSRQTLFVEDRLPPERRVQDKDSGALLDHVVLRFGKDSQLLDYLGQEGINGTPFPYIVGLYSVGSDDLVVVSMLQTAWLVHWFDADGVLLGSLRLNRGDLPMPEKGQGLIASLDKILPELSGRSLLIKVDYYKDTVDTSAKASAGAAFDSSWIFRMNLGDGSYVDRWEVRAVEKSIKSSDGHTVKYSIVPGLLGVASHFFLFIYADDEGKTFVSSYDRNTRASVKYGIEISTDELYSDAYFLSPDGVLCAILGSKYGAKIVWWRFDKFLAGQGTGIVK